MCIRDRCRIVRNIMVPWVSSVSYTHLSLNKITEAIKKAFKATGKDYNNEILELLSLRVTSDFQGKMHEGSISVEQIQDSVEHVLEQTGYTDVAKAYILYRKQREKIRNMKTKMCIRDRTYSAVRPWAPFPKTTSVGLKYVNACMIDTSSFWYYHITVIHDMPDGKSRRFLLC